MGKSTLIIACVMTTTCLSGCIYPVPHRSERSPEVRGRVTDSVTKVPIESATIALHDHPSIAAHSDSEGVYRIRATHNVHLVTFLGICSSEFPQGKYYGDELDISHPDYEPTQIRARQYRDPQTTNGTPLVLRDIALVPISKP